MADICLDLGIAPRLCLPQMWNALFNVIYGMQGSLVRLKRGFNRREESFEPEMRPTPQLTLPEVTPEGIRRVLGFFIGEPPVLPDWTPPPPPGMAVAATGPP